MEKIAENELLNTPEFLPVEGGHMFYRKCIVTTGEEPIFIKQFDPGMFSNPAAMEHTLGHLRKEASVYKTLRQYGYTHLPKNFAYRNNTLYLSACLPQDGWHWELPAEPELQADYVKEVVMALSDLERFSGSLLGEVERPSMLEVYQEGWEKLIDPKVRAQALDRLGEFEAEFHPHVEEGVKTLDQILSGNIAPYLEQVYDHLDEPVTAFGHFDARQTNIAWHKEQGVSIVDWSWASPAPLGCDKTMFLIDLFKSGYDVADLLSDNFNQGHALLQIGHWAVRSTLPGHNGDNTIRFHQMASAVSAATLLS